MNTLPQPTKYFLYIRKSTDEEDRQVLSLEAQLAELKEYAEKENLEIIETFIEKKTAKVPGREIGKIKKIGEKKNLENKKKIYKKKTRESSGQRNLQFHAQ